jgi:transcriptional regulator with XRE-family HTH domain
MHYTQVVESIRDIVTRNFNRLVDSSPLSKKEIAQKMKVDPSTLQRWGSGDSFPELPNIQKLADILRVSTAEFYQAEEPIIKVEPPSKLLRKLLLIPDHIYEKIEDFGDDEDVWTDIEVALNRAKIRKESKIQSNGA